MKWKWLAGCLACLLLLCGCRATVEVNESVYTDNTTHNTTIQSFKTNKPYVYPILAKYSSLDDYCKAVSKVHTVEDLSSIFYGNVVNEEKMTMFLKDKFFLLPHLDEKVRFTKIEFEGKGGVTSFLCEVNESCGTHAYHEPCYMRISISHHKTTAHEYGKNTVVLDADFLTQDGTQFAIVKTDVSDNDGYDEWEKDTGRVYCHWTEEGYHIAVSTDAYCDTEEDCLEKHVKALRFEKVEIT